MPSTPPLITVWSVEGRFVHLVYSPKGETEGFMIDTDGVATQFVVDPHDAASTALLGALRPGQPVVVQGTERPPSPKGAAEHVVYDLHRVARIDGKAAPRTRAGSAVQGRVARLNYARHGAPNGVVLDTGDFVHLRPEGFARLGLQPGDRISAEGPARSLAGGRGRVIEAVAVNGRRLPGPPEH